MHILNTSVYPETYNNIYVKQGHILKKLSCKDD